MSLAEDSAEFEPSRCAEDGCDEPVTHLEQNREGHRLTCEEHAVEAAVELDTYDFEYDRTVARGGPKEDWPRPILQLESVAHQVCEFWQKESLFVGDGPDRERDERTISVVVRDGDGEIAGESRLWDFGGTYALVRVKSSEVEPLPDPEERPELPGWAEWVNCDPPVHHHVRAVRCSECDETKDVLSERMPAAVAKYEPWKSIDHRADCSQAAQKDREIWAEKQLAIEVTARPSPRVMALDCIWSEIEDLHGNRGLRWGYAETAIDNRFQSIFHVLEDRMQTNYPSCPDCGGEIRREDEWGLSCRSCHERIDDDTYQDWWDQHRRLWGTRGQGDRGYDPEEARS